MSLISFGVIFVLFLSETFAYFSVDVVEELFVDSTSADLRVDIHFDLTFPKLPCTFLSIDVMDIGGTNQHDVKDDIFKLRLDANGQKIDGVNPIKQGLFLLLYNLLCLGINKNSTDSPKPTKEVLCGSCYGAADG